jgi:hypothetical protein
MTSLPILTILAGKRNQGLIDSAILKIKPPHNQAWHVKKIRLTIKVKKLLIATGFMPFY